MRYSIEDLRKEFPTDDACLAYIFKKKYHHLEGYYRVRTRKAYCNAVGHCIYPLKGTIFENSKTALTTWFYALFLFSTSKHGVSAAELARQTGVTYKCAFRMGHQIRSLMKQGTDKLFGIVEADETYVGGRVRTSTWGKKHIPVVGMATRTGTVRAKVVPDHTEYSIIPFVEASVRKGATLYTDGAPVYNTTNKYKRGVVWHSHREYVRGNVHTNTIENFWGGLKRKIKSTHRVVSKEYLQFYVDESAFVWNHRQQVFQALLERL